jgi:hypothetical protein
MDDRHSRRDALRCLAFGGAGTLFALCGGVPVPIDAAHAATPKAAALRPFFLQISDTHIGFNKEANPDVAGTLRKSIEMVNALAERPSLTIHTGDITQLTKPEEFDTAQQIFSTLKAGDLHTVPGEHDVTDGTGEEYFRRFGKVSNNRGYYSFDQDGVHFVALVNVMSFKPGGLGALGDAQLAWLESDLRARTASTPIVVFAHMPLWTIYDPWGWGTDDADRAMALLKRFASVTVLNGHIHQIVRRTEGHIVFHTARSTAFPQPEAGNGPGPGPLKVAPDRLPQMLGFTSLTIDDGQAVLQDTTLA